MLLKLTLFGRHGCHLCEVMQRELEQILADYPYELAIEDVDSREDWRRRYGARVPVLADENGRELCHYHLDETAVLAWLLSGR